MIDTNNKFDPFAGPEIEKVVYTTKAQSEIWTACYFGGNDAARAYNDSLTMEFIGSLDSIAMNRAIQTLVEQHEALRATFSTNGIYMSILKQLTLELTDLDLSNLDEIAKSEAWDQYLKEEAHFLFDLVQGPLIKFSLLKLSENNHRLIITTHHIICDGWSIGIMLQDLGTIYSAYAENKIPELTVPIPFSAYANEEQLFSKSDENKATESYWYKMYEESIPIVDVPTDNPRPSLRTFKSDRLDFDLDSNLLSDLKQTGLSVGSSLVTTMLTSFEIFLCQLTGQDDLVVGLPAAGQAVTGMNHLIGHCVNLLPLRSKPILSMSFKDYLKQRKSELFDAYDHQQLSFGHLLQKLNIARDPSRIPLVPIVFNIDMGMTNGVRFSNLTYTLISNPRAYENFEIILNASGTEKSLVCEWTYNKTLFKPETINKMMISFEKILQKIVEDPSKTLEEIMYQDYTSEYSKTNATTASYPDISISELFRKQAENTPKNIAIEFNNIETTYSDLNKKTNQIAHYLVNQGLKSGDVIGVSLLRSTDLVATLIAILKCGCAYVPLDPNFPPQRLEFMLEDSEAKFLITNKKTNLAFSNSIKTYFLEDLLSYLPELPNTPLDIVVNQDSIAYILYTSGSTGKPKGVPITQKSLVNLLFSLAKEPGIKESDKQLAITTISFDAAFVELFLPLLNGASIIMVDSETARDGVLLLDILKSKNITMLQATPTTWEMLLESNWDKKLNIKACAGGEALTKELARKLLSKCDSLWNLYGPTEATIVSTVKEITLEDEIISIGKPIANYQIYILNSNGQLVPPGVVGEIAISGHGVAKGYLKRENLTQEKFIINKFNSQLTYLTGDIGKLLPSGDILCLGRLDHQVKIRGYRIELGEIEKTIEKIDNIKTAIVLGQNDSLVAYILQENFIDIDTDKIKEWKNYLASQLPEYFVPYDFKILKELPTTPNGKLDRNALLKIESVKAISKTSYIEPRTQTEKLVATIWKESLNIENIDIFSNFFEIGGHSIRAVKVMVEIEKQTGKRIPLSSLFENSTIEKFAKLIDSDGEIFSDCLVPMKPNGTKVPFFIVHGAGLNVLNFVNVIKHFDAEQPIYGIQGTAKKYDQWYESIEDMATHYIEAIVKINPNGPYALAGFSFGGVVAFEMARQLKEQGKTVSLIGLLDSYVDSSYYYKTYQQKKLIRYYDINLRRLDYLKEMILSWKAFKMRINAKKEHILKRYFGLKDIMTEQEALAHQQFILANSMVDKIVNRYHLKPQNFKVDLFRAKDDDNYKLDPTHLGWKKAALNGVQIHNISGNHLDIVAPPNDKVLARLLQEILDERHANL
jgi:amino acid adenylation domain-containing protein